MSGAEVWFVIGSIANVIQLVDYGLRTSHRARIFVHNGQGIPPPFHGLQRQLPLLNQVLQESRDDFESGVLSDDVWAMLSPIIEQCNSDGEALEALLLKVLPKAGSAKFRIYWKAAFSLRKDKDVEQLGASLGRGLDTLLNYRAAAGGLSKADRRNETELELLVLSAGARDDQRQLEKLAEVIGALYCSSRFEHERLCYEGTRTEILDDILQWCQGSSNESIYWLTGMAGTGKSTISRTIAAFLDQNSSTQETRVFDSRDVSISGLPTTHGTIERAISIDESSSNSNTLLPAGTVLGGTYFFGRGQGDSARADKPIMTLVAQLARKVPGFAKSLAQAISMSAGIVELKKLEQWQTLILQPLHNINALATPEHALVFVIDVLDECERSEDLSTPLHIFSKLSTTSPVRLETCNDSPVNSLPKQSRRQLALHDVPSAETNRDLNIFIREEFARICKARKQSVGWSQEEVISKLTDAAGEVFIYTAVATPFIFTSDRSLLWCIAVIFNANQTSSVTKSVDDIYTSILRHFFRTELG